MTSIAPAPEGITLNAGRDNPITTYNRSFSWPDLMILLTAETTRHDVAITDITADVIKDSRGTPTISVTVTAGEHTGTFAVPGGASTGVREAAVLPAQHAVDVLNRVIKPALLGHSVTDQTGVDQLFHCLPRFGDRHVVEFHPR